MMAESKAEVYLLVDIGHVLTHVAYVAPVEGTARLAAVAEASTTTAGSPDGLLEGLRRAVGNLELLIGRQLLDSAGGLRRPRDSDGHGVDGVAVSTSLASPLKVALVGLTQDLSLASALRAISVPYITVTRMISLEASTRRCETEDLEALVQDPPDAVVLVGGIDGGPVAPIRDMGESLSAACSVLPENQRPVVLFAGNERAHRSLIAAFSGVLDLRLLPNVRPSIRTENLGELRSELTRLFYSRELTHADELHTVSIWAGANVMYQLDAMARTLRFIAGRYSLQNGVLGIDIGGGGSRVLLVYPKGAALTWGTPFGTGMGLAALRKMGNPTGVVRWMHHPLSWAEAWERLSNVEVRPAGVPQSDEDWDLQEASAREVLDHSWAGARAAWADYAGAARVDRPVDLILARGTVLSCARTPGQAALTLLDGLQPHGLSRLALDWANLLPGLTGLAQLNPLAAVQVTDNDALLELGTLVAPRGSIRRGATAARVRLLVQGERRAELSVPAGSIRRLPLGVNERGRLEIHLARGLNLGRPGRSVVAEVRGGALGVIVDARGRPLALPADETIRRETLESWQREIDEA